MSAPKDPVEPPPPSIAVMDYATLCKAHRTVSESLHTPNKVALMAVLSAAGITHVTVSFDGYGDSGQIEHIDVRAGATAAELPHVDVVLSRIDFGDEAPNISTLLLGEAIETLVYDFLTETHDGWQDNDGAFGDFVFDVAAGTITLDFNERYIATENHTHSF